MHLLIDVGNTRVKWALVEDEFNNELTTHYGSLQNLAHSIESIDVSKTRVLLAAVNKTLELKAFLKAYKFKEITVATSQAHQASIINSYDQPERMGVDRWLAMIAAYHLYSHPISNSTGIIIVDAGSALTIDVVDAKGLHQGGYIVPGFQMSQSALFSNTEQVRRYDEPFSKQGLDDKRSLLGKNTIQCVEYGVLTQQVALINHIKQQYLEYELVITGGDCGLLAEFLTTAKVDKDLVLKGLWQVRN